MISYILIWTGLASLVGFAGINRKGVFWRAFLFGLFFSPIIAIILVFGTGRKDAIGCKHCGNKYLRN